MQSQSAVIRQFIIKNVAAHPADITALTADTFEISRQAAFRHVDALVEEKVLSSAGETRGTLYHLVTKNDSFMVSLAENVEEDLVFDQHVLPLLATYPQNVLRICNYGFTEMCNNVVDHSDGTTMTVQVRTNADAIALDVADDGIGIFLKIQKAFNLPDQRSAIIELAKGKLTTDPAKHTGQGIFFTSRTFDEFSIFSGNLFFSHKAGFDAQDYGDWLLEHGQNRKGTFVHMLIHSDTHHEIKSVMDQFSSTDGHYSFSKTHVPLTLAEHENGILISRSQAKRVLARFQEFEEVFLDFKGVESIGQAFADEIFRVFRLHNPAVKLVYINANQDVRDMINRALSAKPSDGQAELF